MQIRVALLDEDKLIEEFLITRLSTHTFNFCTGDLCFAGDGVPISLLLEPMEIVESLVMRSESPLRRESSSFAGLRDDLRRVGFFGCRKRNFFQYFVLTDKQLQLLPTRILRSPRRNVVQQTDLCLRSVPHSHKTIHKLYFISHAHFILHPPQPHPNPQSPQKMQLSGQPQSTEAIRIHQVGQQFYMNITLRVRTNSLGNLNPYPLRLLNDQKRDRSINNTINRLRQMKTSYDRPFMTSHPHVAQEEEDEVIFRDVNAVYQEDFNIKSKDLCEEICFQLDAFGKLFKQNHHKKSILAKLYGWDDSFAEIFFYKSGEMRIDISSAHIHQKLGLSIRSLRNRNIYNKLRLFLSELISNNKRQQEMQGRFMKIRLGHQLNKLDRQIREVLLGERDSRKKYVDEIVKTQELMLGTKLKVHNKIDSVREIQMKTGKVSIKEFYFKEESNIDAIEKYFTQVKLGPKN